MKRLVLVLALATAGCHTISSQAIREAGDSALAGDFALQHWSEITDVQKKRVVYALTRSYYDMQLDVLGVAVPASYTQTDSSAAVSK